MKLIESSRKKNFTKYYCPKCFLVPLLEWHHYVAVILVLLLTFFAVGLFVLTHWQTESTLHNIYYMYLTNASSTKAQGNDILFIFFSPQSEQRWMFRGQSLLWWSMWPMTQSYYIFHTHCCRTMRTHWDEHP